ncbi:N-acetylmuramoyl-L-alanine amidase [Luteococcus sp. OSA5]|uniref:N-acetylmuramoyl-L-alanine amidase n=1 Tax=Luteococcus sp. OSA5 TaxID=3401630 RepID=UPI003B42B215
MKRNPLRLFRVGLVSLALVQGVAVTTAHAGPLPQQDPLPAAPAPQQQPDADTVALSPSTQTVTVDGAPHRVLAQLEPTTRDFTMTGLTWADLQGEASFQVRTKTAEGWQLWETIELEDLPGEGVGRKGSDPVFVGEANAVEARIITSATTPATITDPQLALINSEQAAGDENLPTTSEPKVSAAAASSGVARPSIVSRAGWGADESWLRINGSSCVPANLANTIRAAIVHHTAGTNSYSSAQSASIVRGIYAYHVKTLGWCDIGYNFLIDKYGKIYEGRHGGMELPVRGAHATSWNTDTVGVSVMMNSSTAQQSAAAMSAMSRVVAWKLAGNYRDPNAKLTLAGKYINTIARHGDVMATSCPGTNITAAMPSFRSQVTQAMGNWKTPIYQAWIAQGGESGKLGSPYVLERPWNGGRTTTFAKGGIFLTPGGQTYWMNSAIDYIYRQSSNFSQLGWPTGNMTTDSAGVNRVRFEKGTIHSSTSTGTHLTTGVVDSWLRANPAKAAQLGAPVAAAVPTGTDEGTQQFANGSLRWDGTRVTTGSGEHGDLDGDRRADVLSADGAGALTWYRTNSNLQSEAGRAGSKLGFAVNWMSHLPDLNGDGHGELLARRSSDGSLWAWNGAGSGNYTNPRQVGWNWQGMREITVMPDMLKDGLPEIVGISKTHTLHRYTLNRDVRVTTAAQIGRGWDGMKQIATVGDIRGAGVVDLLAVDAQGLLFTYHGTTDGRLSGRRTQIGRGWSSFTEIRGMGDVHGGGSWDLLAVPASGPLRVYANRGGGSWGYPVSMMPSVSGLGTIA